MMGSILSFLLSSLLLYKYWAIFLVVLASSIIVPVPANTVLLAAGAFAGQGYFSFFAAFGVAVLANMIGDCFDFFLARKYGHRALRILHVRIPAYFDRLEGFVRKYPGSTIFLTRFVGTIEPLTSLLCGFVGIGIRKFIFYDFIGNIVSLGVVLYAGYFLGIYWQDFTGFFSTTDYVLIGITLITGFFVAFRHNKHKRFGL